MLAGVGRVVGTGTTGGVVVVVVVGKGTILEPNDPNELPSTIELNASSTFLQTPFSSEYPAAH